MAKPNYSYEKRQRELAKKKKKEEKAARKAQGKVEGGEAEAGSPDNLEDDAFQAAAQEEAAPADAPAGPVATSNSGAA